MFFESTTLVYHSETDAEWQLQLYYLDRMRSDHAKPHYLYYQYTNRNEVWNDLNLSIAYYGRLFVHYNFDRVGHRKYKLHEHYTRLWTENYRGTRASYLTNSPPCAIEYQASVDRL